MTWLLQVENFPQAKSFMSFSGNVPTDVCGSLPSKFAIQRNQANVWLFLQFPANKQSINGLKRFTNQSLGKVEKHQHDSIIEHWS